MVFWSTLFCLPFIYISARWGNNRFDIYSGFFVVIIILPKIGSISWLKKIEWVKKLIESLRCSMIVAWVFSLITTCILIFFIEKILHYHSLNDQAGFLGLVLVANFIAVFLWEHPEKPRMYWFFLLIVMGFVSLIIFSVPKVAMAQFHFGGFNVERLLVDEKGCKIFKRFKLASKQTTNEEASSEDDEDCLHENIKILSRLGREYRLEKEINGKKINFSIPKENVLSWSITKPKEDENDSEKNSKQDSKRTKEKQWPKGQPA